MDCEIMTEWEEFEISFINVVSKVDQRDQREVEQELLEMRDDFKETASGNHILWKHLVLMMQDHYVIGTLIENFQAEYQEHQEKLGELLGEIFAQVSKLIALNGGEKDDVPKQTPTGLPSQFV